ncbi:MAG: hypothetical protein QXH03_08520 [Candidatus Bathyarchaeia archaeon]
MSREFTLCPRLFNNLKFKPVHAVYRQLKILGVQEERGWFHKFLKIRGTGTPHGEVGQVPLLGYGSPVKSLAALKRSLLTEEHVLPISLAVDEATRHNVKLAREIIEIVERPEPTVKHLQNLCPDI